MSEFAKSKRRQSVNCVIRAAANRYEVSSTISEETLPSEFAARLLGYGWPRCTEHNLVQYDAVSRDDTPNWPQPCTCHALGVGPEHIVTPNFGEYSPFKPRQGWYFVAAFKAQRDRKLIAFQSGIEAQGIDR